MALQSLQITAITAMRARDVSRPTQEQQEAADRRPLRDESPRKEPLAGSLRTASPHATGRPTGRQGRPLAASERVLKPWVSFSRNLRQ
ncbi:hypothetical protein ACFQX6_58270 [Streptosporangium lutulentum]